MPSFSQFQEQYALNPESRQHLVKETTPDTEEHYLYRLQYLSQLLQTADVPITTEVVDDTLSLLKEAEDSGVITNSVLFGQLKTQIALLAFPVKPDILLKHIGLDVDSNNAGALDRGLDLASTDDSSSSFGLENLSTTLDQNIIKTEILCEKLIDSIHEGNQIKSDVWPHLIAQPRTEKILEELDTNVLLNIWRGLDVKYSPRSLEIIAKADTSRFDQVIVMIILRLYREKKINFHYGMSMLTQAQLDAIRKEEPEQLMKDEGFVSLLERRIVPEPFPESEDDATKGWLERMQAFVEQLSPKFNFHKLSVYLMGLENDMAKGVMNKEKFLRYLAIPRAQSHYNQKTLLRHDRDIQINLDQYNALQYWSDRVSPATRKRDDDVVKEFLTYFMRESKSSSEFEEYFEIKTFLDPLLAHTMLTSGDSNVTKWSNLLPADESIGKLAEKTILRFAANNPSKFLPSDPVVFKLRVKNAKRILIRVFEVKTLEYLQQYQGEIIGEKLNLDGLTPNWEHNITLSLPSLEIHDILIELPELSNRRGAFVLDVISNGENSTAYFTKGCLDFIEKQSVAGHVLTVIDEHQEKLSEKCSIWLNGYYYKPNGDGDIIIPYRKPSSSSGSFIYLIHDGFGTRKPFNHQVENYTLKLASHIDHESLVAGSVAKIIIKPTLQIQGHVVLCPISLLERIQLTIEYLDANNIATTVTVPDFKVHDVDWSEYTFQVPENLSRLSVTLSGIVKVISTGEHQVLSSSREYKFQNPSSDQYVNFEKNGTWASSLVPGEVLTLLRKRKDSYSILALGRNGEKRVGIPLAFEAKHFIWTNHLTFYLRTDDNGEVFLGPLRDIKSLRCTTSQKKWNIEGHEEYVGSTRIHGIEDETISIPFRRYDIGTIRKIALFSVSEPDYWECALADHTSNIRVENGLLTIKGLKAGYYSFRVGESISCTLVITRSNATKSKIPGLEDFVVGSNPMLEISESAKHPLYITEPVANSSHVNIQLYNWSPETRVCVVATKFVPLYDGGLFQHLKVVESDMPWSMFKTELTPVAFKAGRVLGEEYQYILNRKNRANHWAGNLLTKPSALLSPWSIAETTMSKEVIKEAIIDNIELMQAKEMSHRMAPRMAMAQGQSAYAFGLGGATPRSPSLLNFLVHPSAVLINLTPDPSTGMISVPIITFKEGTFLQIFASDGFQAIQQTFNVPRPTGSGFEFQRRDLRFKCQLIHTNHYIAERTGINLDPAPNTSSSSTSTTASVTLASNGSSSSAVRVINSVKQIYDLMLTLLQNEEDKKNLRDFGVIADWHQLSHPAKLERLSKLGCHEFHLFLYKKDKSFFDVSVAPFLKNKLVKSFMDDYLIGASLEKYVALHEFKNLTCMEKCLLAQRIPSIRPAVVRWIKDRIRNVRHASSVRLFRTIMNSGGMKESGPGARGGDKALSPRYSPTSPQYSPTSPGYAATSTLRVQNGESEEDDNEESDEDMGFALLDEIQLSAPAAPAAPITRLDPAAERTNVTFRNRNMDDRIISEKVVNYQFKPAELTKEMSETYYFGRQDFKASDDDEANVFWLDLAQWDESNSRLFLSQNFIANTGSFTDAMATIALLDVSFRPKDALLSRSDTHNLVISSQSPAIIFHSSTKELTETPVTGSVLVTQQYFEQTEKTRYDESLRSNVRNYIPPGTELKPIESYGAHVVIMNATPNPMLVHLEVQIPQGSISIYGSFESGQDIQLSAHGTFQYEYGFYFPVEGDFPHYPAHVSNYEDIIAFAAPAILKVRAPAPDRKETDTGTWGYILKHGTKNDILAKLESSPLTSLPEDQLLSRLYKDRSFLQQVTSTLRSRQEFNQKIWGVSLMVQDRELVKEYLMNQTTATIDVGDWFTSSIYICKPQSRLSSEWDNSFRYLEYFPLINARAHKATRNSEILNDKFKYQYSHFLRYLCQKPDHDIKDLLMLVVYLLAQDRIEDGKKFFKELHLKMSTNSTLPSEFFQLQYDYLWAYLSLCVEIQVDSSAKEFGIDFTDIRAVINKYCDYPVERWRKMFKDVRSYVDEILQSCLEIKHSTSDAPDSKALPAAEDDSNEDDGDEEDDNAPEVPVMVDFKIGNENVMVVRHRGVREITVEYYSIDAETMFSASPLTLCEQSENESTSGEAIPLGNSNRSGSDDSSNSYRLVKPTGTDSHSVKRAVANDGILMIPVLAQYQNTNVIISVSTSPPAATHTWKAFYSQTILVQCMERTGVIKVISKTDGRPIRGGYVKVYAELKQNSTAIFWKDGYTDLVGRFEYALVSTGVTSDSSTDDGGLGGVKRFAVFVDGGREGCVVRTLPVPPV
ncbi:hypothetical protein BGZ76_004566 [Entomortierella beljakovae]|nr:hypothetical protein BGZ76_004566 [Entomortierella beljakovae]